MLGSNFVQVLNFGPVLFDSPGLMELVVTIRLFRLLFKPLAVALNFWETFDLVLQLRSNLEFVNSVDLGELHVVVEQSLGDDVQDAQPLCRQHKLIFRLSTFGVSVSPL